MNTDGLHKNETIILVNDIQ